jgi:hypothetical protein
MSFIVRFSLVRWEGFEGLKVIVRVEWTWVREIL